MKRQIAKQSITIPVYKMVTDEHQTQHGVFTSRESVPNGTLTGSVELRIDVEGLIARLGARALYAKGKKAGMGSGLIEVVVDKASLRREGET